MQSWNPPKKAGKSFVFCLNFCIYLNIQPNLSSNNPNQLDVVIPHPTFSIVLFQRQVPKTKQLRNLIAFQHSILLYLKYHKDLSRNVCRGQSLGWPIKAFCCHFGQPCLVLWYVTMGQHTAPEGYREIHSKSYTFFKTRYDL